MKIDFHSEGIMRAYRKQLENPPARPFYASFDLRNSGFKIAPVDANLFPAGWNNLSQRQLDTAADAFRSHIGIDRKRVLILSENHSTNAYYFENLRVLQATLIQAGFDARSGFQGHPLWTKVQEVTTSSQMRMTLSPIVFRNTTVELSDGWTPDLIVSNYDGAHGFTPEWTQVRTPILPPISMGWYRRNKCWFFKKWDQQAIRLGEFLGLDPWHFRVKTYHVGEVDFKTGARMEELADTIDRLIDELHREYQQRGIKMSPKAFVKHASGTYGMGVTTAQSGKEFRDLNRKVRNKMAVGKGKQTISNVLVQESIPTLSSTGVPDEPVMYSVGFQVVGGFMRVNPTRGVDDNLNSMGMAFRSLDAISSAEKELYDAVAGHCTLVIAHELEEYGDASKVSTPTSHC